VKAQQPTLFQNNNRGGLAAERHVGALRGVNVGLREPCSDFRFKTTEMQL
jgi:hypothetical protein